MLNPRARVDLYETLREADTRGLVVESDSSPRSLSERLRCGHRNSIPNGLGRGSFDGDTPD